MCFMFDKKKIGFSIYFFFFFYRDLSLLKGWILSMCKHRRITLKLNIKPDVKFESDSPEFTHR